MDDKEKEGKEQYVYLYLAILRKKENDINGKRVFRQIIHDNETDLNIIKEKCKKIPGIWRIYKCVNKRDRFKAKDLMMIELIKNPHKEVTSLYRTCLLQPECKAGNNFLIDIDDKNYIEEIKAMLVNLKVPILEETHTPNGYHIVTDKFDTRVFEDYKQKKILEIKKDAYIFVQLYEVIKVT